MSMSDSTKSGLDKNNKYDRQLRLWGDHGQCALENAKVCLINATATGTEILKNLILPGIGSFTIVDGHKVMGEDVGNNFFLTKDCIGKSRAQTTTELLSELNDDVCGDFLEESVSDLLQKNPKFFTSFTVVIATQLEENTLLNLGKILWEKNVPLMVCRCYGTIGYLRLVLQEHTVIEAHPDSNHEDLRLDKPFQALKDFCDSLDLDSMNKKDHSHTPWLVLIYKFLQVWQQENNGRFPSNYKEKNALKDLIKKGKRTNEEGIPEDEENFDEALKNVNSSLHGTRIPSDIQSLFNDPKCLDVNSESKIFWMLVKALKQFTENEGNGLLPVRGVIPDMTADSERYISLQNVYKEKAATDAMAVTEHLHTLLQQLGRPETVTETEIKQFCKNSAFLTLVRCRRLEEEYNSETANLQELGRHVIEEDEECSAEGDETVLYIMLRAADRFFSEYNRYPGAFTSEVEADIPKLKTCTNKLLHEWGFSSTVKDDFIQEMCRYGASELHTVSAFMGGVAAQEVIKVVTGQFVPINNTFIYNAQKQTSTTLKL